MRVIAWCKEVVWNKHEVEVKAKTLAEIVDMSSDEFESSITDWITIVDSNTDCNSEPNWDLAQLEVSILDK